ncbi:MAG: hypothetical protein ACFE9L_18440, partial [Candidatus Hodarchaeota archaeon]
MNRSPNFVIMIDQINLKRIIPIKLRLLISVTFFLAVLGLLVGLPLLLFNLNLPSMEGVEHDTKEHMELSIRYAMRFFGVFFTIFGLTSLSGCFLTYRKSRIGWFILVGLYSIGLVGCFYLIYRFIKLVFDFNLNSWLLISAIPSPLTAIIIWGVFS